MEIVHGGPSEPAEPIGREMTQWEKIISAIKYRAIRLRRRLPYLVWWNDELDVTVTLSQDKLPMVELPADRMGEALRPLFSGAFAEIERTFLEMGITFDTGMGGDGRDWEWDWSLKGPISIRFRSRCQRPHLRRERPKPTLMKVPAA